jgi:hypothetical protein
MKENQSLMIESNLETIDVIIDRANGLSIEKNNSKILPKIDFFIKTLANGEINTKVIKFSNYNEKFTFSYVYTEDKKTKGRIIIFTSKHINLLYSNYASIIFPDYKAQLDQSVLRSYFRDFIGIKFLLANLLLNKKIVIIGSMFQFFHFILSLILNLDEILLGKFEAKIYSESLSNIEFINGVGSLKNHQTELKQINSKDFCLVNLSMMQCFGSYEVPFLRTLENNLRKSKDSEIKIMLGVLEDLINGKTNIFNTYVSKVDKDFFSEVANVSIGTKNKS